MKNLVLVVMFALALTMGIVACAPQKTEEVAPVDTTATMMKVDSAAVDTTVADTTKPAM